MTEQRTAQLLIVDDEIDMLEGLKRLLTYELDGTRILTTSKPHEALKMIGREPFDTVLLDVRMPQMDGIELLDAILKVFPWMTVIMMTAYGSIEVAVEAIKHGAYDFVTKPFDKDVLFRALKKGLERNRLIRENMDLQYRVGEKADFENLIGRSPAMRRLFENIRAIARSHYTVLLRGESGTGKELVARAIHNLSNRRNRRLVAVNCPATPEHLMESELFGHRKGAFTGADRDQAGLFEEADGGSILLDEIGDIPVNIQTKLLRVLQEGEIKPLGTNKTYKVDVRVIASTNQNLEEKIRARSFREDLFYRLNVVTIRTPSLKETREDIPLLINHFARITCGELGIAPKRFTTKAIEECMKRPWPGNVRELQSFVRRAVMLCPDDIISPRDLVFEEASIFSSRDDSIGINAGVDEVEPYKRAKERAVKHFTLNYVSELLGKTGGNVSRAAELSGISRTALQKIMRRLDVKTESYREGD